MATDYRKVWLEIAKLPAIIGIVVSILSCIVNGVRQVGGNEIVQKEVCICFSLMMVGALYSVLVWYINYINIFDSKIVISNVSFFLRKRIREVYSKEVLCVRISRRNIILGYGDIEIATKAGDVVVFRRISEPKLCMAELCDRIIGA